MSAVWYKVMQSLQIKHLSPTSYDQQIILMQSPHSRAINVGYIQDQTFIPGRLNYGVQRMLDTHEATIQSLQIPEVQEILKKYDPKDISTLVIMREAIACNLPVALLRAGVKNHFGDAFIGSTHIKDRGNITTDYKYENTEGLVRDGLWVAADSICMGRSFIPTFTSLFSKGIMPKEILLLAPICSRRGVETFAGLLAKHNIKVTFLAWGALFGVGENLYDMPWGHPDTEVLDPRDQEVFATIYGDKLCVGGDFGNDYFSPTLAQELYDQQIQELGITPKIPSVEEIKKIYKKDEILIR